MLDGVRPVVLLDYVNCCSSAGVSRFSTIWNAARSWGLLGHVEVFAGGSLQSLCRHRAPSILLLQPMPVRTAVASDAVPSRTCGTIATPDEHPLRQSTRRASSSKKPFSIATPGWSTLGETSLVCLGHLGPRRWSQTFGGGSRAACVSGS